MPIAASFLLCLSRTHAFDPGAAAGDWRLLTFTVPSQLTLERNAQGIVTNIPEAAMFEISTGSLTVLSNGTFSGTAPDPISGTISGGGQGEVIFNLDAGPSPLTFHVNRTVDFLATSGTFEPEVNDLILALRSPAALTTNDLAGLWNATALVTPYELVLERDSSNRVTNLRGFGSFETFGGTVTINADGTIHGNIQGAFTGVVTSASSGVVSLTVTNEESDVIPLSLFVNASKDVMAYVEGAFSAEDNYQQVMILQKAAASNPVSQLAGQWRIVAFDVPELTPQFNGFGQLIALEGNDNFDAARQSLVAGYDGFFTAQVGGPATGTLSPATSGLLVLDIDSEDGAETLGFQLNASETLLGSSRYLGDGWEIVLVTKSPPLGGAAQDYGLVMLPATNGLTLAWAAAANSVLQSSGDLTNWNTLSATLGQHTYTTGTSNSAAFYRVLQPMP